MNYYNYYTEIEEHFVRRRGKHMWISPLDWSLIHTWKQSGVPMHVALRGIDIAMDGWLSKPRRSSDRLSTLFYCHDAVMAEYARHLESRVGVGREESREGPGKTPAEGEAGLARGEVLRFLEKRIDEIRLLLEKHKGSGIEHDLSRISARLEEIVRNAREAEAPDFESLDRDLGILDEVLVVALKPMVPEEETDSWLLEAKKELKIYKKRLGKETYQRIVDNFIRGKMHRYFQVGELSLFHM